MGYQPGCDNLQIKMAFSVPRVVFVCMVSTIVMSSPINGIVLNGGACPCSDQTLCDPIRTNPKKEIVAFSPNGASWRKYFWDNITTVIAEDGFDPQMMCHAHSKGVRIVTSGAFSLATLFNNSARTAWVVRTVQSCVGNFTDGFNIDFEEVLSKSDAGVLTDMIQQFTDAFKKALPYSKITLDTPYSPGCTYGRCYDYTAIGNIIDYIMIMAYDELAIDGRAMANGPLNKTIGGVDEFVKAGLPPNKLVLIVPWYGYDFPCTLVTQGDVCLYKVSTQIQRGYGDMMKLLDNNSTTGRKWSEADKSPYFDYKDSKTGQTHQIWYDDPTSLTLRYNMAKDKGLYGVSVFHADCLDYSTHQKAVNETNAMWDAFIGE